MKNEANNYAFKQIAYISKNGCNGIKCKYCCLTRLCDHFPSHSQQLANEMILMARSQENKNG